MPPPPDSKVQCIAIMAALLAVQSTQSQSWNPTSFVSFAIQLYNEVEAQLTP